MIKAKIPRLMIVGTGSGCGKTTVTCALLKILCNLKLNVSSFKCGPDYIDPMFHSKVLGTHSRNLDLFMCGEQVCKYILYKNSLDSDIAVIEGVMGMYDGALIDGNYSSNHLSLVTQTPQILVVNAGGKSLSLVAEISGYVNFMQNNIKGVIINNTSKAMYEVYKDMIEKHLSVKVLGFLETNNECVIESRHLGLVTANEISDINLKLDKLAQSAKDTLDINALLQIAREYSDYECMPFDVKQGEKKVKIAVALDLPFCFYYEDNLDLLRHLGAEIVYFSPLKDERLPENISGIILGGGYPEEYCEALSENKSMLESIRGAYAAKIPIIAECGGFMYLGKSITDKFGIKHPMANIIDTDFYMTKSLAPFGYVTLTALKDNLLCKQGEQLKGHDFHYSKCDDNGNGFRVEKLSGKSWNAIYADEQLWCGYTHLHFLGNIHAAQNFISKCMEAPQWQK